MRIHSFAHADVEEASKAHLFAAVVQVAAVWENVEAHDQALADEGNHPAFVVFEAAGIDVTHSLMTVVGFLGR